MTSAHRPLRILLLGAGGQVGRALHRALPTVGSLTALDHRDLDITNDREVVAMLRNTAPELVVNAAAYTDVDGAEREPELAHAVNAVAPGTLARAVAATGAALVHYSTDYVFDGSSETPWPENAPPGPLGAYGRSKLAGERAIEAAGAGHLIVRTSWIYGAGGKNFVETMLRLGAERERLSVVDDQFGAPTSAGVVADVTAGIIALCRDDVVGGLRATGGVLHVTCDGWTSWHGFAEEIFRQARARDIALRVRQVDTIGSLEYGAAARRPRNSRLDCRRLIDRFGLHPPHWKRALEQYFEERG